jgi:branched-chain amino acid transport system permease protein
VRRAQAAGTGAIVAASAAMLAVPALAGDYAISVVFTLLMWIALTQSWVVLSGLTGYISLGHAVFFGLGAYVLVLTWPALPLWLAILLAGIAAPALAFAVGYPCLRVRGPYFVILTFGLAELVKYIVVNVEGALGQFSRVLFAAPGIGDLYPVMVALAGAATLLAYLVRRSRFGTGLRAIRENEAAAETLGVDVALYKVLAFAASAAIPGMVGAVMALRTTYFEPLQVFSPITSFTIVVIAIIGGGDDAPGPIWGALFLVLLQELLWARLPQIYLIVLGVLLIAFVLWSPNGFHGLLQRQLRERRR